MESSTSQQLFERISWDRRFDPSKIKIWYRQPFETTLTCVDYSDWDPDHSPVPWDRIDAVTYETTKIWESTSPVVDFNPVDPTAAIPLLGYTGGRWTPIVRWKAEPLPLEFSLVSLNLLFELYAPEMTEFAPRWLLIVEELKSAEPDVICFQEVTPEIFERIERDPWIAENYYLCFTPFKKYGQLTLTKYRPLMISNLVLNPMKRANRVVFEDHRRQPLTLYNLHLTSQQAKNAVAKRKEQLELIEADLPRVGSAVMVGDFNTTEAELSFTHDWTDCWTELRPGEKGYTFDTDKNELARKLVDRPIRLRLDRVYLKSSTLRARAIDLIGDRPVGGQFLSDHFGLTLQLTGRSPISSGAYLLPPLSEHADWIEKIGSVPRMFIARLKRDPPKKALSNFRRIETDGFRLKTVRIRSSKMLIAEPVDQKPFHELRELIDPSSKGMAWAAHYVLGYYHTEEEAEMVKPIFSDLLHRRTRFNSWCLLDDQRVIHRFDGDRPMVESTEEVVTQIGRLLKLLHEKVDLEVVGSRELLGGADSDLNLLLLGTRPETDFLRRFRRRAEELLEFDSVVEVTDRRNYPRLAIRTAGGLDVSLLYTTATDPKVVIKGAAVELRDYLKLYTGHSEVYQMALCFIRRWAKARKLWGDGYPTATVYALMLAKLWQYEKPADYDQAVRLFFLTYSDPISGPLMLREEDELEIYLDSSSLADSLCPVMSPVPPKVNTFIEVYPGTLDRWRSEVQQFSERLSQTTASPAVLTPPGRGGVGIGVEINFEAPTSPLFGRLRATLEDGIQRLRAKFGRKIDEFDPHGWTIERLSGSYQFYVPTKNDYLAASLATFISEVSSLHPAATVYFLYHVA